MTAPTVFGRLDNLEEMDQVTYDWLQENVGYTPLGWYPGETGFEFVHEADAVMFRLIYGC